MYAASERAQNAPTRLFGLAYYAHISRAFAGAPGFALARVRVSV